MNRILALIVIASTPFIAAGALAQDAAGPAQYSPGQPIPAELALMERSPEGGRSTPIFDPYRPSIVFDDAEPVTCEFFTDINGGHRPGTTNPMRLVCPVAVREGQSFTAFERNRKVGTGVVTGGAAAAGGGR
ncbi:hypothetical protein GRI97_04380 [Altererythrobacter xixiisoli]|uniref:Uncharacterized protein n=1 Tax=Croceibacterium xixiisoli TaxID=1476466 RepID=A0A6I4TQP1_9SPHN|nr:hypothetical protein [Croceibacterium xixiisoli]MXO98222.1 hypothetical protein [Croceibacterium xixiisoli]